MYIMYMYGDTECDAESRQVACCHISPSKWSFLKPSVSYMCTRGWLSHNTDLPTPTCPMSSGVKVIPRPRLIKLNSWETTSWLASCQISCQSVDDARIGIPINFQLQSIHCCLLGREFGGSLTSDLVSMVTPQAVQSYSPSNDTKFIQQVERKPEIRPFSYVAAQLLPDIIT